MTDVSAEPPVLTRIENGVGRITLNRPKVLHALNTEMCLEITRALLAWQDDPAVQAVMIDHTGERGFCAGGDIRLLAESGVGDGVAARRFFLTEYRMNHLLFVYPKPIAAIMDGIVMGGGVGLSAPCKVRIATERTTYAMPETGIGLFPDVGGGWFLPRMPGQSGIWMALTGARLKAADCLALGLATHVVDSGRVEALKSAILDDVEAVFGAPELFAQSPGAAPVQAHRSEIDRLFAFDTMEEIFAALEADGGEWAAGQLAILKTKSPQSLKVSLRQMRTGAKLASFAETMAMEYALAGRIVRTHDFQEGVRAVIVDKDNAPKWSPAEVSGVADVELDRLFAPLSPEEAWSPVV
jgi:enoyl-CoA hydratase